MMRVEGASWCWCIGGWAIPLCCIGSLHTAHYKIIIVIIFISFVAFLDIRQCHRPTICILISDLTNMTTVRNCESSRLVCTKPLPNAHPHIVQSQCTSRLFVRKSHLSRRNATFVTLWQLFNNLFGKKCILDKVCNKQDKTVMNIWVLEHPKVSKLWPYICT